MRLSDFKQKEIININDGKRFGFLNDFDIDEYTGKIKKIIVVENGKIFGIFGKESEYFIAWENIKQIGDDIILIDVDWDKIKNLNLNLLAGKIEFERKNTNSFDMVEVNQKIKNKMQEETRELDDIKKNFS